MSDRTEAALVLVWGQMGKKLQNLDAERMLAVAQDNPNYFLAVTANNEHLAIIRAMKDPKYQDSPKFREKVKAAIRDVSAHDNLFREVTEFLHDSEDMLSTGSFLTGELKNRHASLLLSGVDDNDE